MEELSLSFMQVGQMSFFGALWGMCIMVVAYLLLTLPCRLAIYYSKNYQIAIRSRRIAHWILVVCVVWGSFYLTNIFSWMINYKEFASGEVDAYVGVFLPINFTILGILPLYYVLSTFMGRCDFYSVKQVPYLKYFILYLRSFKDDNRRSPSEEKLMHALRKIYEPYAIGQPDEFMPPRGAKRIYVGADWKDHVIEMQRKAPIILQRINISDNYLWEFEQCVAQGYLNKVIFWVTDFGQYDTFRALIREKYQLDFPELHQNKKREQVFYLREDGTFRIQEVWNPESYNQLIAYHMEDHPHHLQENEAFFHKRDSNLLKEAFDPRYDKQLMPGIDRFAWTGLLFPKFYLICHPIRWRIPLFIFAAGVHALEAICPLKFYQLFMLRYVTNALLMYAFARNGRRLVWLSKRWESKEYYEKVYRRNTWLVILFGVAFNALWIYAVSSGITFARWREAMGE